MINLVGKKSKEINLGLDFALLGGRLAGNIELYNKKTYDLILSQKDSPNQRF